MQHQQFFKRLLTLSLLLGIMVSLGGQPITVDAQSGNPNAYGSDASAPNNAVFVTAAGALHVLAQETSGTALFESTRNVAQIDLLTSEGSDNIWSLVNAPGGRFAVSTSAAGDVFNILNNGNVGIDTPNPTRRFHVYAQGTTGAALFESNQTSAQIDLLSAGGADNIVGMISHSDGRFTIDTVPPGEEFTLLRNGNVGIGVAIPQTKLAVDGTTSTKVLQITGGSDLAEPFEIVGADDIQPGMVVAIDPNNPGQLRLATAAYDYTVAGVVSGAGGINPGLVMQQEGSLAAGSHPVALTGRVYVYADAGNGAIVPGDLLTTSATPGHAMKVIDYERAQGAILGKAMSKLEKGTGLVLMLVTLQ